MPAAPNPFMCAGDRGPKPRWLGCPRSGRFCCDEGTFVGSWPSLSRFFHVYPLAFFLSFFLFSTARWALDQIPTFSPLIVRLINICPFSIGMMYQSKVLQRQNVMPLNRHTHSTHPISKRNTYYLMGSGYISGPIIPESRGFQ